jgi:hypothetical protein
MYQYLIIFFPLDIVFSSQFSEPGEKSDNRVRFLDQVPEFLTDEFYAPDTEGSGNKLDLSALKVNNLCFGYDTAFTVFLIIYLLKLLTPTKCENEQLS